MTSAAKRTSDRRRDGGFTILELVIVLAIAMLIIGSGMGLMYVNRDEARLNEASRSIEVLAKRARTIATLEQKPYALEFRDREVTLMPYAQALLDPGDRESLLESTGEAPRGGQTNWTGDEEMSLQVMRWGGSDWIPVTKLDRQIWRFDPGGICEPIGVRINMEESWIAVQFHPLTASIAYTEMEVP